MPFYLRTGKRMAEGAAHHLDNASREPPKSMFPVGSGVGAVRPRPPHLRPRRRVEVSLSFYGKRPGPGMKLEKLSHTVRASTRPGPRGTCSRPTSGSSTTR